MTNFADTHIGKLRRLVGSRLLLVPAARIVIENAIGQILLQKRSDFGVWGLPGGSVEEAEDSKAAIIREVAEETSLRVADVRPFGFGCDPALETCTFPNGDRCQFFVLNFYTREFEGVARVSDDESLALDWFLPSGLPEMLPNMQRSIEAYARFQTSGEFQMI